MTDKKALDLATDYAEIIIDEVAEASKISLPILSEMAIEAPIIRTFIIALTAPRTISDQMLGHKISQFLYASNLDSKKIEKLREKIKRKSFDKTLRNLVLSINSHDQEERSAILGKVFQALLNDEISLREYNEMQYITNNINLSYLDSLKSMYSLAENVTSGHRSVFLNYGLVGIDESLMGTMGYGGGPMYPLTSLGWKFTGIAFDHPVTAIEGVRMGVGELHPVLTEGGIPSNVALPMSVIEGQDLRRSQVELYAIEPNFRIGCDKGGMPHILSKRYTAIGETNDSLAHKLMVELGIDPTTTIKALFMNFDGNVNRVAYGVITNIDALGLRGERFIEVFNNMHNWPNPNDIGNYSFAFLDVLLNYQQENPEAIYGKIE